MAERGRMEKRQGFFSALKVEVARGWSPGRSRARSPGPSPRKKSGAGEPDPSVARSGSFGLTGGTLAPLMEGPDADGGETGGSKRFGSGLGSWFWDQLIRSPSGTNDNGSGNKRSDLRLLLGVMGAPLAPVHVSTTGPLAQLSLNDTPIEASSAQYILQQYTASCGGQSVQSSIKNAYAMGKVKMVTSEFQSTTKVVKHKNTARLGESGSFVLWQMNPDMWYVELAVGGCKICAGSNGKLVWRHTPWLGAHSAKGPARPLRRALQGLDPRATASIFSEAICTGEKTIDDETCFVLKLSADYDTLKARSEGSTKIIRHTLFGYFSQRTGLLVHLEDSHLTCIQMGGGDSVYWETTASSSLGDYHPVEGVMVAHSGRSVVTLMRFGQAAMSHTRTRMEEEWTIEEVAFNVPGLSVDCFIPPGDLKACLADGEISQEEEAGGSTVAVGSRSSKVAAMEM